MSAPRCNFPGDSDRNNHCLHAIIAVGTESLRNHTREDVCLASPIDTSDHDRRHRLMTTIARAVAVITTALVAGLWAGTGTALAEVHVSADNAVRGADAVLTFRVPTKPEHAGAYHTGQRRPSGCDLGENRADVRLDRPARP